MCVPTDDSETEESADLPQEVGSIDEDAIASTIAAPITDTLIENTNTALFEEEDKQLEFILMVLIPLILLALLFLSVVLIVIKYKRKKTKQGKYFACSQFQTIASCVNE